MSALAIALTLVSAVKPVSSFLPKNRPYDAVRYRVEVDLSAGDDTFNNKLLMTLKPKRALSEIELDCYNLEIKQASINGIPAPFRQKADPSQRLGTLTLKSKAGLVAGREVNLEIVYSGKAGIEHQGLFKIDGAGPNGGAAYYTMFEPLAAQQFFPNNDDPTDKALTETYTIVNSSYTVVSNGRKELDEVYTSEGKNLRRVLWKQDKPHSTYLVALAVGNFESLDVGGETSATLWVRPGTANRAFVAQDSTRALLSHHASIVGVKYPWSKADQVAVPQFFWSGMENTGVIFNRENKFVVPHPTDIVSRPLIVGLISHELAHQWFGNYVTCKTWQDVWLNEGFATWLGYQGQDKYLDSDYVEVLRATRLWNDYFRQENGPRSHALLSKGVASVEETFDSVSYQKGAQVLRMLELAVGSLEMKRILKAYLEKHALGNANSDDFFKVVFEVTKKSGELQAFKDTWLYKRGYPIITPESRFADGKLTVTIRQRPNLADEQGPFVFKLPIVIHRETEPKYSQEQTVLVDKNEVTVTFDVQAAPQWINWNKDSIALASIDASAVSEQQWVDSARYDSDPVWRTLAAWVLTGELSNPDMAAETKPTDRAMAAVIDVLAKDPSPYVREAVLKRLAQTRWKKLPAELGQVVLKLAKRPEGFAEDAIGTVLVRHAAISLLGKIDFSEGRSYSLVELARSEIDINFVGAYAKSAAMIATDDSIGVLRAALRKQKERGEGYYAPTALALMNVRNADALGLAFDELAANATNGELAKNMIGELRDNFVFKADPAFAGRVRDFILNLPDAPLAVKAQTLQLLEDIKTKEAKEALNQIAVQSTFERIRGVAKQILDANFKLPTSKPKR